MSNSNRPVAGKPAVDVRISGTVEQAAARFRRIRLFTWLGLVWIAAAIIAAVLLWMHATGRGSFPGSASWLAVGAVVAAIITIAAGYSSFRNPIWVAERIEQKYPELQQRLITSLGLRPNTSDGHLGYLQHVVIDETVRHGYVHRWADVVPARKLFGAHAFHLCAFVLAIFAVWRLGRIEPVAVPVQTIAEQDSAPAEGEFELNVDPGNTEIEKGTHLVVAAKFAARVPNETSLVWKTASGTEERADMSRSLADPLFAATVRDVREELTYRVEYAGRQSEDFRVTVFEYPELLKSDARLEFPSYTQQPTKTIEDTHRVSAVEGTQLTWLCHLNKPITKGELIDEEGQTVPLLPDAMNPHLYSATIKLLETTKWKVQLIDDSGRANKLQYDLIANVLKNQPPELKLAVARDARVSPLEEFPIEGSYWDDFGLKQFGLTYSLGAESPQDVVLGESTAQRERRQVSHQIDFEKLQAAPDQLLSYHLWAEDVGPDGQARRVYSDMFFAEVRHFEEIFREGEAPAGEPQAGQNAGEAGNLAELQKEIVTGTWNVIRREANAAPGEKFVEDVQLLHDSQTTALEQLEELAGRVNDPQSKKFVDDVRQHMQSAIDQLGKSRDEKSNDTLRTALTAEQAAYQALLKLREREHQVVRSQSRSRSSNSGRMQEQLQQLELDKDNNPYETERRPTAEQDQQQRENQQVLNRLRELARRQKDINEQLKRLQTALEEAKTEQEKEQIREQLKRLQEQQEELLRDTDELLDRMDQPQNQRDMAESRDQLEQTRENVRESSESLQNNDVSQSLSAGTRAEREFEKMRDDFRNRAANQFSEEMREMVDQARKLEEQQEQLAQDLTQKQEERPTLSDTAQDSDKVVERLEQQKKNLEELLERMRQTVQEAETTEPLLAQELYDSFRETKQRQVEERLKATGQLLERNLRPQAQEMEQIAREGISDLRRDIEKAAESVLGDEVESLRRAVAELDQLSKELNQEIQNSDPSQRAANEQRERNQNANEQANQPGNQNEQQPEQNQQQPGENAQQQGEQSQQPGANPSQQGQRAQRQQQEDQNRPQQQNQGIAGLGSSRPNQSLRNEAPDRRRAEQANRNQSGGGGLERLADESQQSAPLTGSDFVDWSDRMRDVEEMLDDRDLRGDVARIRDRAGQFRRDFTRQARPPQWNLVQKMVAEPLEELKQRVSEELLRRSAERNELVPIDRDPVPDQYADRVRQYYENLGSGK